jgi:hypothetical protein
MYYNEHDNKQMERKTARPAARGGIGGTDALPSPDNNNSSGNTVNVAGGTVSSAFAQSDRHDICQGRGH